MFGTVLHVGWGGSGNPADLFLPQIVGVFGIRTVSKRQGNHEIISLRALKPRSQRFGLSAQECWFRQAGTSSYLGRPPTRPDGCWFGG